jgi:hypothetical protein
MKPRDRLVLAIVGLAGITAAFWFLALAPERRHARALALQVAQAQVRRDAAAAKAAAAERAKARYATDYATVARLGKALPPRADVPSLVFQLESAARAAKVDLRRIVVEDAPPEAPGTSTARSAARSGISPAPFSFDLEGSFFGLQRTLHAIGGFSRVEGSTVSIGGRLLTLDRVSLSAGRGGLPRVRARISATAYVAPIPPALPGRPAARAASTPPTAAPASQVAP